MVALSWYWSRKLQGLEIFDGGEFARPDYVRNPLDRCFYCKSSLYGSIRPRTSAQIVSGNPSATPLGPI